MRRALWAAFALSVGCAMLPTELIPTQVSYVLRTQWDGVPLVDHERVWTTELGYTVALASFSWRTTSIELVPCELVALLDPRPSVALAHGSAYQHDISAVEPALFEDLIEESATQRGHAITSLSSYCEFFGVHGTGRDETVVSLQGWYQSPGSDERVTLSAEHPFGMSELSALDPLGSWNDTLLPNAAQIEVTRFPARSFEGLRLDELPPIDLAYGVGENLIRSTVVEWSMGPMRE